MPLLGDMLFAAPVVHFEANSSKTPWMQTFTIFVFIGLAALLSHKFYSSVDAQVKKQMHCMVCGAEAAPRSVLKGSLAIAVVLWLFFLLPGLIYSLWRMKSRHGVCAACGSPLLVPLDAPAAIAQNKSFVPNSQNMV